MIPSYFRFYAFYSIISVKSTKFLIQILPSLPPVAISFLSSRISMAVVINGCPAVSSSRANYSSQSWCPCAKMVTETIKAKHCLLGMLGSRRSHTRPLLIHPRRCHTRTDVYPYTLEKGDCISSPLLACKCVLHPRTKSVMLHTHK